MFHVARFRLTRSQQLAQAIERKIMQRTLGQMRHLEVKAVDGHVVVSGCTPTYYVKQLAIAGIQDVLDSAADDEWDLVDVRLDVSTNGSREARTTR